MRYNCLKATSQMCFCDTWTSMLVCCLQTDQLGPTRERKIERKGKKGNPKSYKHASQICTHDNGTTWWQMELYASLHAACRLSNWTHQRKKKGKKKRKGKRDVTLRDNVSRMQADCALMTHGTTCTCKSAACRLGSTRERKRERKKEKKREITEKVKRKEKRKEKG